MTCDFTSFLTGFQSYQDDVLMMMNGRVHVTPFTVEKISTRVKIELGPLGR